MTFAMSHSVQSGSLFGKPTTQRLTRDMPRRGCIAVCSHKNEEPVYALVMRKAVAAAAAAMLLVRHFRLALNCCLHRRSSVDH